jgi:AbrB family looped-hinge helix DNA binding protein
MRVTSKGQVTIPIEIRKLLDISAETEVEFRVVGDIVEIHKVLGATPRSKRVLERLQGARYSGPSTQELMALTRAEP